MKIIIDLVLIIGIFLVFSPVYAITNNGEKEIAVSHSSAKLLGKWHLVTMISRVHTQLPEDMCTKITFTRVPDEQSLLMTSTEIDRGVLHSWQNFTKIDGIQMIIHTKDDLKVNQYVVHFDIFPDSGLMIFYNENQNFSHTIFSRRPFVEPEILKPYTDLAHKNSWSVQYTNVDLCVLRDNKQKAIDENLTAKLIGEWTLKYNICPTTLCGNGLPIRFASKLEFTNSSDGDMEVQNRVYRGKNFVYEPIKDMRIFNGQLYNLQRDVLNPDIYDITFYDNDNDVLLRNIKNEECSTVYSRRPTVPDDFVAEYKKIAENDGLRFLANEC